MQTKTLSARNQIISASARKGSLMTMEFMWLKIQTFIHKIKTFKYLDY